MARPQGIVRLDYEPELVFVIGRRALGVKKVDAMDYVAGVTILNDLTCRDLQKKEVASGSRFWTGKNIPGFGPLGPEIVTLDEIPDPYDLWMTCAVNGEERMRVNTRDQIWKLPEILEHFSRYIPIEPGDMFSTGAPGGVAVGKPNAAELFLKPGDVVECSIEGIATLRTTIVAPGRVLMSRFARSSPPLVAALALAPAPAAFAQAYPAKTVKIVVPFPPGGGADTLARIMGPYLTKIWGQTGGGGEQAGRERPHRRRGGRAVAAGRLHAPHGLHRGARPRRT